MDDLFFMARIDVHLDSSNHVNPIFVGQAQLNAVNEMVPSPLSTAIMTEKTELKEDAIHISAHSATLPPSQYIKMESMIGGYSIRFEKRLRVIGSQMHTVVFAIQKLRMDKLRSILNDISNPFSANYGNHLTRAEVTKLTSNPKGSKNLLQFLKNHTHYTGNVEVLTMTPSKDYITARAAIAHWEEIFKTNFFYFHSRQVESQKGGTILSRLRYSLCCD